MSQQQVLEHLQAQVGQEIHCSDWLEITQARIDAFAAATGDHQWIHTDAGARRAGVARTRRPSRTAT